ncbi:hypothetical protein ACQR35_09350 [Pseudarthrobacter sp. J1738]|uniref:hypothetical protein n=1 Tax=unclassified Pseudarthrobacter TaxID=2647000 RepID=UPI003D27121B
MIEIGGLPAHILLIHAVLIFALLAGVGAVVFAFWRRSRKYLAWPLGVLSVILVPLAVITAEAGEQLEHALGASEAVRIHAAQGSAFRVVVFIFFLVVVAQILAAFPSVLQRWDALRGIQRVLEIRWVGPVTSVLGVAAGAFLIYDTILTGHSGASAVWLGR